MVILKLCGRCARLAEDSYHIEPLSLEGKTEKCGNCGKRAYVLEYEVIKR